MKRIFKFLLVVIIAGGFVFLMYFLYAKSQKPPVVYKTESAITASIARKAVATGSIIPRREVFIKPQVSGIIEKVFVVAGNSIKSGDVIAQVRIIPNMVSLNEAESRLSRAKIEEENAQKDFDRNKPLIEQGVISKADFQHYEVALKNSSNETEAAQNNLDLIKSGITKKTGQATNTLIRSTITGMILDVPVKEGFSVIETNNFNEGTTIASVADMGEMIFEGKVDESEVGKLNTGMDLILTVGAITDKKFNAKLEYISPKGVLENGAIQFQIRAAVKLDQSTFLRAGYSGNADIILEKKDSVLAVPESLVTFEGDTAYIEKETANQQFKKVMIKTGISDGINIEVLSGITKSDKLKSPQTVDEEGKAK